ncbi:MAG: TA system VapC family ribonuclease toxin [Acidobacteriota bacterium]
MISVDTNILLYAQNADCSEHPSAINFLTDIAGRDDVIICELVLVELYLLLRNPAVLSAPLSASQAVAVCQAFRTNPRWRLIENAPVMLRVWQDAEAQDFARRRIIDLRLALTLQHHGVDEFATANLKDFQGVGFERVWNPVVPG